MSTVVNQIRCCFLLCSDPPSTFNSHMAPCRTTTQCGARTLHLPDGWRTFFGSYFLSLMYRSLCMAPVFICMLHSLLLQSGHALLSDDLLSAFDWGWGHFMLFYYLMCIHTADFNCCIHTLILPINAVPLSKSEELFEIIDLFIFLFLIDRIIYSTIKFPLAQSMLKIMQLSIFSVVTTSIHSAQNNKS